MSDEKSNAGQLVDRPVKLDEFDRLIALHEKRAERNFDAEDLIPKRLTFEPGKLGKKTTLLVSNGEFKQLPLTDRALGQTLSLLDVPATYGFRLLEHDPTFLCESLHRSAKESDDSWLVRYREPENGGAFVRAVLKNNFACVDNLDLLKMFAQVKEAASVLALVLPTQKGNALGDTIDLQAVQRDLSTRVAGDKYLAGLHVINSEVGDCRTQIDASVFRVICTNGLIAPVDDGIRFSQYHVGRRLDNLDQDVLHVIENLKKVVGPTISMLARSRRHTISGLDVADSPVPEQLRRAINTSSKTRCGGEVVDLFLAREDHTIYGLIQAISRIANEQPPVQATRLRNLAADPNRAALSNVFAQVVVPAAA